MKRTLQIAVALFIAGCSSQKTPDKLAPRREAEATAGTEARPAETTPSTDEAKSPSADEAKSPSVDEGKSPPATIKPLTAEQRERLLSARLDGGMDLPFRQFANMFLVSSRIHFGIGVGLMSSSREIA